MPQGKEQVHQNVQVTESSVTDTDNENKDGAEQAPKKPTILESWRKVFSLNLRSLNRDDAWNFGKTVTFAGVGYFLYSYLPKGLNGPNGGFNNPNNPGGPNGPNRPRVIGEDDDFDIDGFDLEQRRQQEEAFARYEREKENRRIAQEQAERDRRALEQAEQLNRQVQEVARRDRERVERERELQRQEEARRQQETFERAERNRVAQVEQAERDRRMQREREAAEYEQGIRWAREERARLLEEQRQQRQAEHERLAQRERERQAVDQERYQQHSADVAQRIERGLPIRLYAEWLAGQQSQDVRERQAQEDREHERQATERRERRLEAQRQVEERNRLEQQERDRRAERDRVARQERERQLQVERDRRAAERAEQLRQLQEQAERTRLAREEAQRQEERNRLAQEAQARQQAETRRMREDFQRQLEVRAERERQLQQQEANELAEAMRLSQLDEDERVRNASVTVNNSEVEVPAPVDENQAPQVVVDITQQRDCDICTDTKNVNEFSTMPCCQYSLCTTCLGEHLTERLRNNQLEAVTCPNQDCPTKKIEQHIMRAITVNNRALFDRYLNVEINEGLREIPGVRQCRTADCNFMYFPHDENTPGSVVCQRCHERYCSHCGFNHAENMNCEQAARERDPDLAEQASLAVIARITKQCPNCNDPIEKNGGCNHMTCQKCRHEFCWTCLATYRTTRCNSAECETYGIRTGLNF